MYRGYIGLWRKIQDHDFYKEKRVFSKFEAWIDILMEAQHKKEPQQILFGMTMLTCNYGESLKSIRTWAKRWGWTEAKVYRYTKLLESVGQIVTQSETVTTRLKVLNYEQYDPKCNTKRNSSDRRNETRAKHERVTDNNVNNVNNDTSEENDNDSKPYFLTDSQQYLLAKRLHDQISYRHENYKYPDLQKEAYKIDLMMRLGTKNIKGQISTERIRRVIDWCQADDGDGKWAGWQDNIRSVGKLRDKFFDLESRMGKRKVDSFDPDDYLKGLENDSKRINRITT